MNNLSTSEIENVDSEKIKNEFFSELGATAEVEKADPKNKVDDVRPREPVKPRSGFLDKFFVEQFCEFKNNHITQKLSHDLSETGKSLVKEVYATTPEEVDAWNNLAEYGCAQFMPSDWLDSMETFFKHPASGVLKIEIQKYRMLSKKLDALREKGA